MSGCFIIVLELELELELDVESYGPFWYLSVFSVEEKLGIVFFGHSVLSFGSGAKRSKYYSIDTPETGLFFFALSFIPLFLSHYYL